MIYELRIYHAMPGKMPALEKRFKDLVVGLLEKHGIEALGFWKSDVGPSNQTITWMVAFEDAGDRARKWAALTSDPEWLDGKAKSELNGEILSHWENRLLTPTEYSKLR
jgi:hypothetical protein